MGKTYGFLFTNYYPELLRKHKAQGGYCDNKF